MNTIFIEPKYVDNVVILENESDVLEFVKFFSSSPRDLYEDGSALPKLWTSQYVLMPMALFIELRGKYKASFNPVFLGTLQLIIRDILFSLVSQYLWKYPEEIMNDYNRRLVEGCELYYVRFTSEVEHA